MFKAREKPSFLTRLRRFLWPESGIVRSTRYILLRLKRVDDTPMRVAVGVFCGVFISFTPFVGFHFFLAVFFAYLLRANILSALLATFVGNPITFPFIAAFCMTTGNWILGYDNSKYSQTMLGLFNMAWSDVTRNFLAIFTPATAQWEGLATFSKFVLLPYFVGGLIPGLFCAFIAARLTLSFIRIGRTRRQMRRAKQK